MEGAEEHDAQFRPGCSIGKFHNLAFVTHALYALSEYGRAATARTFRLCVSPSLLRRNFLQLPLNILHLIFLALCSHPTFIFGRTNTPTFARITVSPATISASFRLNSCNIRSCTCPQPVERSDQLAVR